MFRALAAMGVCWLAGWVVGLVAQRLVHEHVEAYKREHPIPLDDLIPPAAGEPEAPAAMTQEKART